MFGRSKLLMNSRAPRVVVGGGGERDARHVREALVQLRELQVVLAEVVAPLADAMRLVDRDQAQQPALVQRRQHRHETRVRHAFRRGVQQYEAAAHQLALDVLRGVAAQRRVQERGGNAELLERADLVVHQRDQRADDQRHAVPRAVARDRRHLVAQALAAAGGHQHHRVAAAGDGLDDVSLLAAERAVAEDLLQDRVQILRRSQLALAARGGVARDQRRGARGREGIEVVVVVEI
jgi:hypothetical protein